MNEADEEKAKRLAQLSEKLALARLEHEVKSLETRVIDILKSPKSGELAIFCVFDASSLIDSLDIIKNWIMAKSIKTIIPFSSTALMFVLIYLLMHTLALEELDRLKKGTDIVNVNARSVIRFLERFSNKMHEDWVVRTQKPSETVDWPTCVSLFSLNSEVENILLKYNMNQGSSGSIESRHKETITAHKTPRNLRSLISFMVYLKKNYMAGFISYQLITDNPITAAWAKLFSIQTSTMSQLKADIALNEQKCFNLKKKYTPTSKKQFKSGYTKSPFISPRKGKETSLI